MDESIHSLRILQKLISRAAAADKEAVVASFESSARAESSCDASSPSSLRVAEVVAALSQALDLGAGAARWHSVRTCILGMRIALELHLDEDTQSDLFYSLLLKDAGCSSNASQIYNALGSDDIAAKRDVKKTDWTKTSFETLQYALTHIAPGKPFLERVRAILHVASRQKQQSREVTAIRCERGATMARLMGLSERTAEAIGGLDEHWDGSGNPEGLRGSRIPLASRIMLLAQTLDVYFTSVGAEQAVQVIKQRSSTWFDPQLIKAVVALAKNDRLWADLKTSDLQSRDLLSLALTFEPRPLVMSQSEVGLDAVCQAFAQIVDAKSPFTYNHSNGVANAAVAIAQNLGLEPARVIFIRHAALLHDLGKMAVSNAILEKPGKPDEAEWEILRAHPAHTWEILRCISGFEELSEVAASHHEKLNGKGYHRGLSADQLTLDSRILVVADIFDALSAKRPYRDSLPLERVFEIIRKDTPHALDISCVEALEQSGMGCDQTFIDLQTLSNRLAQEHRQSSLVPEESGALVSR